MTHYTLTFTFWKSKLGPGASEEGISYVCTDAFALNVQIHETCENYRLTFGSVRQKTYTCTHFLKLLSGDVKQIGSSYPPPPPENI